METNHKPFWLALGCQTMREGVVASLVFFIGGVLLIGAGIGIVPDIWHLQHIILMMGFLVLLFAPIILISTFLLSVLPGAKEKMDQCEH
jgi:hypothetical protein